jgi:amidase
VFDWKTLNANSKEYDDERRIALLNWGNTASQPQIHDRPNGRFPTSANVGIPELTVPADFNDVVFEPEFTLNAAKDNYTNTSNDKEQTTLTAPLPFGISFWGGPGDEPTLLRVASLYEAATKHRRPPPESGPCGTCEHCIQ